MYHDIRLLWLDAVRGLASQGRVQKVVLRGRAAFEDGKVLVELGYGQNVRTK